MVKFVYDTEPRRVISLTEAADRLNLDPSTLRHQIRLHRLLASKRGRDWYVTTEEVERYARVHLRKRRTP